MRRLLLLCLVAAALAGCEGAPAQKGGTRERGAAGVTEPKRPYPLDVCLVGDEKLGDPDSIVVLQHEGREVRLCCPACIDIFKKDPGPYLKKLDEAERKQADKSRTHDAHP